MGAESGVEGAVEIKAVPSGERGAMSALLSSAAVVTLLSEYEAHPIAVMEALALRRPTLVAYTSGLMEFADRGLARAVRIDGKPADVAQAILSQIDDPLVPQSVSLPTWEACAESLMDLYRTVARRPVCVS